MIIRAMFRSDANNVLIALVIAVFLHIILISGLNFSVNDEIKSEPIIITMIDNSQISPPQKSHYLAQQNHVGLASQVKQSESSIEKVNLKESPKVNLGKKQINKSSKTSNDKNISHQHVVSKPDKVSVKTDTIESIYRVPQFTAEILQQQISQLGYEIRESQLLAEQSKIKVVDTISSHKYIAAQYIKDWENKVERTGNLNFPAVANKKSFSGSLILDVEINSDGTISAIRINRSSGNVTLDEAAKKIVRMSGPFPPLPLEIAKETNVFLITRVWTFSDESGLNTH